MTMGELTKALSEMDNGKAPGPDEVLTEFFKEFWGVIQNDYLDMVNRAVVDKRFPPGVTRGLISLLHKANSRSQLTNWRPITLLNIAYKLFAKALQMRVHLVLMEIVTMDQSAFLPLRFILDNILLTHETMDWAKFTKQLLIFLKLDFSKAYNMVEWPFLFEAMRKMGFPEEFVEMTQLLFQDVAARVKVNGS